MKKLAALILLLFLSLLPAAAAPLMAPCTETGPTATRCDPINSTNPMPVTVLQYPSGSTVLNGNGSGTTGAVAGSLNAGVGVTTYICGFNVQAIGGTAPVGPITITGLSGGATQTYQGSASAAGGTVASQNFTPCLPASGTNVAIVTTTTADGTATAVNVNSWGYRQ